MPRERLIWQGKEEQKGTYCFHIENIILWNIIIWRLNVCFPQCGHWDAELLPGLPDCLHRLKVKTKIIKNTMFASSKIKGSKANSSFYPWAPQQGNHLLIFSVFCERFWWAKRGLTRAYSPQSRFSGLHYHYWYSVGHNERSLAMREKPLFAIHSFMPFGLKPHSCWPLFWLLLMVFS